MAADGIAVRADYADALIAARRAKGWLVAILLIVLLGEIAIFFTAKYTKLIVPPPVALIRASLTSVYSDQRLLKP